MLECSLYSKLFVCEILTGLVRIYLFYKVYEFEDKYIDLFF